jgi:hypothetical protein
MMRRQIFVSHSTKGPDAQALLDAVAGLLKVRDYEVLLDQQRLAPGDDWYDQISQWIVQCDGALLLWDHQAALSDFVRHEASLLGHRWRTEEAFKLFIARLDDSELSPGLPAEALNNGALGPTRIGHVQMWSDGGEAARDSQALADAIVAAAEPVFGPGNHKMTRHNRIVARLKLLLARVGVEALREAAAHVDDPELQQTLQKLPTRLLDGVLAKWMVNTAKFDVSRVRLLVEQMRHSLRNEYQLLLELLALAEAGWLEGADCPLAMALSKEGGSAIVATNGAYVRNYTLNSLALRALDPGLRWPTIVHCNDLALDKEEVAGEIAASVNASGKPQTFVNHKLKQRRTLCLLPKHFPGGTADYAEIEELSAAFPNVIFVTWPSVEPLSPEDVPYGALIVPAIDLDREEKRYADWDELTQVLADQAQG